LDHVRPAEGVVEELAAPEDARLPRTQEELVAHDLEPEVVDLLALGEEAMPAQVEAVAVGVDDGLRQAADLLVGLEDDDALALLRQEVAGVQSGGAAADDDIGTPLRAGRGRREIEIRKTHGPHLSPCTRGFSPAATRRSPLLKGDTSGLYSLRTA